VEHCRISSKYEYGLWLCVLIVCTGYIGYYENNGFSHIQDMEAPVKHMVIRLPAKYSFLMKNRFVLATEMYVYFCDYLGSLIALPLLSFLSDFQPVWRG
jgi:hypothetical protein